MTLITSIQPRPEPTGRADGAADAADAVEFTVPDCVIRTAEAVAARFGSTLADILFMALRTGLASAGSIGLVAPQHRDCWDGATTRVVIGPAQ